jgi:hypothetical protein
MSTFLRIYPQLNTLKEQLPYKSWVKMIPEDRVIPFQSYEHKDAFIKVADIILDTELNEDGGVKRQTDIYYKPVIDSFSFKEEYEWLYTLVINGQIVKIGGTRKGLYDRMQSYNCGRHIKERGKSGYCSKTNGFIYNTLCFYLETGHEVELFAKKLNPHYVNDTIFENTVKERLIRIKAQIYHAIESEYICDFEQTNGFKPFLCDNSDPNHRKKMKNPTCKGVTKEGKPCTHQCKMGFGDFCRTHAPKDFQQ